jgi:hypothetical protein
MSIGSDALSSYPLSSSGGEVLNLDVTVSVDGFTSTQFGTPGVIHNQIGWQEAVFGTPASISNRIVQASGWDASPHFGTPGHGASVQPSGFLATVFGTPNVYPQLAYGFKATAFGSPYGFAIAPPSRTVYPADWKATLFGSHRSATLHAAPGFFAPSFGLPTVSIAHRPSGFVDTSFGIPRCSVHLSASGFLATKFGSAFGYSSAPISSLLLVDSVFVISRERKVFVVTA